MKIEKDDGRIDSCGFLRAICVSDQSMGIFLSKSMIEALSSDVRHVFTENGLDSEDGNNRDFSIKSVISGYIWNLGKTRTVTGVFFNFPAHFNERNITFAPPRPYNYYGDISQRNHGGSSELALFEVSWSYDEVFGANFGTSLLNLFVYRHNFKLHLPTN